MQAAIDRIMQAYGLIVPLAEADAVAVRRRVEAYLLEMEGDERTLAIEGLRYLRSAYLAPREAKPASGA